MVNAHDQTAFTHAGPGTPASAWRAHAGWGSGEQLALAGISRVVVVAAHPDDESLGAGGLIAAAARSGLRVEIVCATDGEGSHPESPTHTPQDLAAIRAVEGTRAARLLGVAGVRRAELPDGDVTGHEEELTTLLVSVVGDGRDTVIVAPWRHDGHPDHEAAGRAAATTARRTGAELWEYPVWFWHWGDPEDAPWSRLQPFLLDDEAVGAKRQAIGAHVSQVAPLSTRAGDGALLGVTLLAHFDEGPEHYLRTASADAPDEALNRLHQQSEDPWGVDTRWYERRKRDLVLAMLPRPEFDNTLEVGSSTGALAAALATRSAQVLAVDSSTAALDVARRRFEDDERVQVSQLEVPREWPEATFDLVVLSEVGYFLSPVELELLVDRIVETLRPHGTLVLCHWQHPTDGWVLDGPEVHRGLLDDRLPAVAATYRDRDVEIRVHTHAADWPDPQR